MKSVLITLGASLLLSATAFADLSESQDHLRNSGYSNYENGSSYEVHPNDFSESQHELRHNGKNQRPEYQSCLEAVFGTDFWWYCQQQNGY